MMGIMLTHWIDAQIELKKDFVDTGFPPAESASCAVQGLSGTLFK
jgi:hypothetical protein